MLVVSSYHTSATYSTVLPVIGVPSAESIPSRRKTLSRPTPPPSAEQPSKINACNHDVLYHVHGGEREREGGGDLTEGAP